MTNRADRYEVTDMYILVDGALVRLARRRSTNELGMQKMSGFQVYNEQLDGPAYSMDWIRREMPEWLV